TMLLVAVLFNVFPQQFLSIYGQDEQFILEGTPVLRVVSLAMLLNSFSIIFLFAVTGSGNTRVTLLIEVFAIIMYTIYVYLTLDKYFLPITYGWMSEWLYWVCMFIPAFWYMKSGKWKGKQL